MKEIKRKNKDDGQAFIEEMKALLGATSDYPIVTKSGKRTLQKINDLMKNKDFRKRLTETHKFFSEVYVVVSDEKLDESEKELNTMISSIAKDFGLPDYPDSPLTEIAILENPKEYLLEQNFGWPDNCVLVHNWIRILAHSQKQRGATKNKANLREDSTFPVSIKIGGNATMADVKKFLATNWPTIERVQRVFNKNSRLTSRESRTEARNDFIWEMRQKDFPYLAIVRMVKHNPRFQGLPIDVDIWTSHHEMSLKPSSRYGNGVRLR